MNLQNPHLVGLKRSMNRIDQFLRPASVLSGDVKRTKKSARNQTIKNSAYDSNKGPGVRDSLAVLKSNNQHTSSQMIYNPNA